jgi:hypothetical protein
VPPAQPAKYSASDQDRISCLVPEVARTFAVTVAPSSNSLRIWLDKIYVGQRKRMGEGGNIDPTNRLGQKEDGSLAGVIEV